MTAPWTQRVAALHALRQAGDELAAAAARRNGLREALEAGEVAAVHGLPGAARLLVPLLATARPLLVVVPHERDVETAADDLRTLAAEAGAEGAVLPFPAPGPAPFRGLPRHADAALLPDVLVKGADWAADRIVGRAEVEAAGGRVVRVELVPGRSTSAVLERIRAR